MISVSWFLTKFWFQFEVDPEYKSKIIGRKGQVINKIRQDHNVQINLPRRGDERENVIKIIGYEDKAKAARDDILKIITELVSTTRQHLSSNSYAKLQRIFSKYIILRVYFTLIIL